MKQFTSLPPVGLSGILTSLMILFWSMSACGRTLTRRFYVDTPVVLCDSSVSVGIDGGEGIGSTIIDVRGAMEGIGERPGLAPAYWGIDMVAGSDTLRLTLRHGNSAFGDILDRRQNILSLHRNGSPVAEKDVSRFESSSGVYNTLRVEIDRRSRVLNVAGGGKSVDDIFSVPLASADNPEQLIVWGRGHLTLSSFSVESVMSPQHAFASTWTADKLTEYLSQSEDEIEGYWRYLDRENDPAYARPGGRYLLALVGNGDGYDIIYVDGAETRRDQWMPMMVKGRLKPTVFIDHYDLEWTDATFETIDRDIHASVTDKTILTLSFPLLKTTLRFSKMPPARK